MKLVFKVDNSKKAEAENMLKADDVINRQSITIRSAESLGIAGLENCFLIILEGSDEAMERAKEILKEKADIIEDYKKIEEKISEEEDNAASGFGNIFG